MSIQKIRSVMYFISKILGDIQAILSPKKNSIIKRIGRRIFGKISGRIMGKLFK